MAIGKLSKGSHAAGLIDYLLGAFDHSGDVRPVVRIVGGTMGFTSQDAKAQFEDFANLRPSLGVNVVHNSISLPTSDRDLSPEEWAKIGDVWACGMGFEGYVTVCHGNHIHIAASRIKLDGSVVSDAHDYRRSEALIREIEERFALAKVDASHLIDPDRTHTHITAPKTAEIEMACKGQASAKGVLQSLLTELTSAPITASDLVALLEAQGVDVRPNISETTGRLSGFSFALDGHAFTASALGRGFTLANLLKKGFSYEQNRDLPTLVRAKERSDAKAFGGRAHGNPPGARGDVSGDTSAAAKERSGDDRGPSTDAGQGKDVNHHSSERSLTRTEGPAGNQSVDQSSSEISPSRSAGDQVRHSASQDNHVATSLGRSSPSGPQSHDTGSTYHADLDGDDWNDLFAFLRKWSAAISRARAAFTSTAAPQRAIGLGLFKQLKHKIAQSAEATRKEPLRLEPDDPSGSKEDDLIEQDDEPPPGLRR